SFSFFLAPVFLSEILPFCIRVLLLFYFTARWARRWFSFFLLSFCLCSFSLFSLMIFLIIFDLFFFYFFSITFLLFFFFFFSFFVVPVFLSDISLFCIRAFLLFSSTASGARRWFSFFLISLSRFSFSLRSLTI